MEKCKNCGYEIMELPVFGWVHTDFDRPMAAIRDALAFKILCAKAQVA